MSTALAVLKRVPSGPVSRITKSRCKIVCRIRQLYSRVSLAYAFPSRASLRTRGRHLGDASARLRPPPAPLPGLRPYASDPPSLPLSSVTSMFCLHAVTCEPPGQTLPVTNSLFHDVQSALKIVYCTLNVCVRGFRFEKLYVFLSVQLGPSRACSLCTHFQARLSSAVGLQFTSDTCY